MLNTGIKDAQHGNRIGPIPSIHIVVSYFIIVLYHCWFAIQLYDVTIQTFSEHHIVNQPLIKPIQIFLEALQLSKALQVPMPPRTTPNPFTLEKEDANGKISF